MFGNWGKPKVSAVEFSAGLGSMFLKVVRKISDDYQQVRAMGFNPYNKNDFFMDLLIIYMYSAHEAFNYIDLSAHKRDLILRGFHEFIKSSVVDEEDYGTFDAFCFERYKEYHDLKGFSGSDYAMRLSGAFCRNLSDNNEADAFAALEMYKRHLKIITTVQDIYSKTRIEFN